MFHKVWKRLKVARKLRLGPASLVFYFERTVAVRRARIERRTDRLMPPDLTQATRGAAEADRLLPDSAPAQSAERRGRELALIIGTGPGLGVALAECLAAEGFELALAARNAPRLESLASHLRAGAGAAVAVYACDATSELSVDALFKQIIGHQGIPCLVVYAIQEFGPGRTIEVEVPAFESAWRHNCFGAFLRCPSNFAFQPAGLMPPLIADLRAC
jgi:hypothetical protein